MQPIPHPAFKSPASRQPPLLKVGLEAVSQRPLAPRFSGAFRVSGCSRALRKEQGGSGRVIIRDGVV